MFAFTCCASHAWKYPFRFLMQILYDYELANRKSGHELYFFIDIFSVNQHNVNGQTELPNLDSAVSGAECLLLVCDNIVSPLPLFRMWCLW
jgi:hypothetical protein